MRRNNGDGEGRINHFKLRVQVFTSGKRKKYLTVKDHGIPASALSDFKERVREEYFKYVILGEFFDDGDVFYDVVGVDVRFSDVDSKWEQINFNPVESNLKKSYEPDFDNSI